MAKKEEQAAPTHHIVLETGSGFYKWEEPGQTFRGSYVSEIYAEEDDEEYQVKEGDIRGYVLRDSEGNEVIIGAAYAIAKAMEKEVELPEEMAKHYKMETASCIAKNVPKAVFEITYKGKLERKGKRPFNQFRVELGF